jgi:hypothetical protein
MPLAARHFRALGTNRSRQLLSCPANRLQWPVDDDSRSGGNQGRLTPRFRAVGCRKGGKQLLNTARGLVRCNELVVHDPSEFFRTRFGAL